MVGILDREIREILKNNLHLYKQEIEGFDEKELSILAIENVFKFSRKVRRESKKIVRENLETQLSVASLYIICCFFITISIYKQEESDSPFLPLTWITSDGKPDPNLVFGHLLTQLILFSIAIVELIELGLDNPARCLCRSLMELSWQILILLAFKEDLKEYLMPQTLEETNNTWYKLFGQKRSQKKLSKIEEMVKIDRKALERLKERRQEYFQFFSESTHHSFPMTLVGSIRWSFDKDEGAWSAFGGASSASTTTIEFLNLTLHYFVQLLFLVFQEIHNLYPETKDSYWSEAIIIKETLNELLYSKVDQ